MEHFAHCRCEVWPLRNLSSGGTIMEDEEEEGMGVGVRLLVKGFDEEEEVV